MALIGAGAWLGMPAAVGALMSAVPAEHAGVGSALNDTSLTEQRDPPGGNRLRAAISRPAVTSRRLPVLFRSRLPARRNTQMDDEYAWCRADTADIAEVARVGPRLTRRPRGRRTR
jgi:hypothetical protein